MYYTELSCSTSLYETYELLVQHNYPKMCKIKCNPEKNFLKCIGHFKRHTEVSKFNVLWKSLITLPTKESDGSVYYIIYGNIVMDMCVI